MRGGNWNALVGYEKANRENRGRELDRVLDVLKQP